MKGKYFYLIQDIKAMVRTQLNELTEDTKRTASESCRNHGINVLKVRSDVEETFMELCFLV